jgi:ribosomal-protein-alanine N-acetyltransferase
VTPDDLAQLHAAAFDDTRGWSAAEFAQLLGQTGVILCDTGHAFALIRVTLDEAELLTLATDPSHRRQGRAKAILAEAESAATNIGAQQMFLEVAEDNAAANALYRKAGYKEVGRRPGYYATKAATPVAALVLRKELTQGQHPE